MKSLNDPTQQNADETAFWERTERDAGKSPANPILSWRETAPDYWRGYLADTPVAFVDVRGGRELAFFDFYGVTLSNANGFTGGGFKDAAGGKLWVEQNWQTAG